jgi:hypothetical protein
MSASTVAFGAVYQAFLDGGTRVGEKVDGVAPVDYFSSPFLFFSHCLGFRVYHSKN